MEEKPTFIKIDKFEAAASAIGAIKKKLAEAQVTLDKINALKQEEDLTVQRWASELNTVQTKIESIESELMSEE